MAYTAKVHKNDEGYYIQFRWQNKRPFITQYKGQISFRNNKELADRSASVINSEIERGVFRPERWKKRSKNLFSVEGYAENWLENVRPSLSAATHFDYSNSFKNHINSVIGYEYIEDVNHDKLLYLLNHINRAPKGKKNVMDAMKRLLKYAYLNGHITMIPPFPELKGSNQVVKKEIRWVTTSDQFKILENIRQEHRPIFTFIALTGCRPSEARAFRKMDIKTTHINFAVTFGRNEELKEVKGKKVMPFPLTEALKELFDSMKKSMGIYQFPNPETGRPYSKNINRIFNRAAKKAGINISLNEWGRKSFAMQALQSIEKGMVSHLLRHQDPRMIDHYAEYQTEPLKSVLDKIQNIGNYYKEKENVILK